MQGLVGNSYDIIISLKITIKVRLSIMIKLLYIFIIDIEFRISK